mmetsp:Transcript_94794/g.178361  ORF Transcript_94794/g.178361 Transcript_94794/m.178361 type:complete len:224 (-) Transcript_94794:490-1161(-)
MPQRYSDRTPELPWGPPCEFPGCPSQRRHLQNSMASCCAPPANRWSWFVAPRLRLTCGLTQSVRPLHVCSLERGRRNSRETRHSRLSSPRPRAPAPALRLEAVARMRHLGRPRLQEPQPERRPPLPGKRRRPELPQPAMPQRQLPVRSAVPSASCHPGRREGRRRRPRPRQRASQRRPKAAAVPGQQQLPRRELRPKRPLRRPPPAVGLRLSLNLRRVKLSAK